MAKSYLQGAGFDYIETFSLVIKPATIRIVLTLTVTYNWSLRKLDTNNAFLNDILFEDAYMAQPSGFRKSIGFGL